MDNKTYNIGSIGKAIFVVKEKKEILHIVVITSTQKDWQTQDNTPLERYKDKLENWQIYQSEGVQEILEDFAKQAQINIQPYYLSATLPKEEEKQVFAEIRKYKSKLVFVVDVFSILFCKDKKWFWEIDQNNKNDLGGILLPICKQYSPEEVKFAKTLAKEKFPFLHEEWEETLRHSFTHAELEIPNKTHFFRRLANIVYYKALIKEKEIDVDLETIREKYKTPEIENLDLDENKTFKLDDLG